MLSKSPREIKFRLRIGNEIVGYERWSNSNAKWMYCVNPDAPWGVWRPESIYHVDKDQFTGLQDKKGTEGYQHDICRFKDDANQDHIGTIEWVGSGWYLVSVENDDEGNYQFELSSREFEIIGNMCENPDLLGKKE